MSIVTLHFHLMIFLRGLNTLLNLNKNGSIRLELQEIDVYLKLKVGHDKKDV